MEEICYCLQLGRLVIGIIWNCVHDDSVSTIKIWVMWQVCCHLNVSFGCVRVGHVRNWRLK